MFSFALVDEPCLGKQLHMFRNKQYFELSSQTSEQRRARKLAFARQVDNRGKGGEMNKDKKDKSVKGKELGKERREYIEG